MRARVSQAFSQLGSVTKWPVPLFYLGVNPTINRRGAQGHLIDLLRVSSDRVKADEEEKTMLSSAWTLKWWKRYCPELFSSLLLASYGGVET
jgi:hypothetical protein